MKNHRNKYSNLLAKHRIEKILNEKLDDDYKKYIGLIDLNQLKKALQSVSKSRISDYGQHKAS